MNTPEQIAEQCLEEIIRKCGGLREWRNSEKALLRNPILDAISLATQPLHQRLIAAEMQVGQLREALKALHDKSSEECLVFFHSDGPDMTATDIGEAYQESDLCEQVCKSLASTPDSRTHEAFTAMVKALETIHNYGGWHRPSPGCKCDVCSAIQLAKEVGVV